jgi:hypothetical protein
MPKVTTGKCSKVQRAYKARRMLLHKRKCPSRAICRQNCHTAPEVAVLPFPAQHYPQGSAGASAVCLA